MTERIAIDSPKFAYPDELPRFLLVRLVLLVLFAACRRTERGLPDTPELALELAAGQFI
jgi:hypothetical protein